MEDDQPQMIRYVPVRCAVCAGFGTLKYGKLVCHACNGHGQIIIDQETGDVVPQIPIDLRNNDAQSSD